jgi:hypothetical protein
MSSPHIVDLLGPFHLGVLDDPDRDMVEDHLRRCPPCLEGFLVLKRRFDRAAPLEDRPSPRVRVSLRQSVALGLPRRRSPGRRLLAYGAAVAAAAALALFLARRDHLTPPQTTPSPLIDSATPSSVL